MSTGFHSILNLILFSGPQKNGMEVQPESYLLPGSYFLLLLLCAILCSNIRHTNWKEEQENVMWSSLLSLILISFLCVREKWEVILTHFSGIFSLHESMNDAARDVLSQMLFLWVWLSFQASQSSIGRWTRVIRRSDVHVAKSSLTNSLDPIKRVYAFSQALHLDFDPR